MTDKLRALLLPGLLFVRLLVRVVLILMGVATLFLGLVMHHFL